MKTNVRTARTAPVRNHEGVPAVPSKPYTELRRAVLACLLWEDQFYETGESIAERIAKLVKVVPAEKVAELAIEARTAFRLRHVPLLLVRELARRPGAKGNLVGRTLSAVIQRADELSEFVSIYWADKKQPLSAQVKLGLAHAFTKFNAYQLGKYRGDDKAVKLRDVLFLCHAKPKDEAQAALWKTLVDGTLPTPDTWEVALSAGEDKKESFERLLRAGELGYLALLRNLRKMLEVRVDEALIRGALSAGAATSKALPFRFIAAARAAPRFEAQLDAALQVATVNMPKLLGTTVVLVDTSPSMRAPLSAKSDLQRIDAACGLAILCREICEEARVFAFSSHIKEVPPRRGMALTDAILQAVPSNGTLLGAAITYVNQTVKYDRLIVVTDEQSQDPVPNAIASGYMVNVSSAAHGIGYGPWTRIAGFSEAILTFIQESERAVEG
jgi:60 kDa SS-A/Ro ribonucleoprotein